MKIHISFSLIPPLCAPRVRPQLSSHCNLHLKGSKVRGAAQSPRLLCISEGNLTFLAKTRMFTLKKVETQLPGFNQEYILNLQVTCSHFFSFSMSKALRRKWDSPTNNSYLFGLVSAGHLGVCIYHPTTNAWNEWCKNPGTETSSMDYQGVLIGFTSNKTSIMSINSRHMPL